MGTKTYNNYEDLLTFTRASKGHALRPVSYGTEQSPNATFTGNIDGWRALNANATVTAENNELKVVTTDISGAILDTAMTLEVGKIYFFTATSTSATVNHGVRIGTTGNASQDVYNNVNQTGPTTFTHVFVATSANLYVYLRSTGGAGTVTWDNISVKEVIFDQPDGTLTLFEHPDNIPRVEWDADRNRLGLLVEESRTNLIYQSEDFTDSNWVSNAMLAFGSGSTSNAIAAPDGTTTADLIVPDTTSSNSHWIRHGVAGETIGNDYTISVYVKAAGYTTCSLRMVGTDAPITNFDLSAETTDQSAATITNVGNGWYRCTLTGEATSTTVWHYVYPNQQATFAGDGTSGIYIWGAQLEEASFPTSHIKTTGSTATRSADVASIPTADFGDNIYEGTIVYEGQDIANNYGAINSSGGFHVWFGYDGNNYIAGCYHSNTGGLTGQVYFRGDGTLETANSATLMSGQSKAGFSYELGKSVAICVDGQSVVEATATVPTAYANTDWKFVIGGASSGATTNTSLIIKSIKYYPRRLTNAQLQDLTS